MSRFLKHRRKSGFRTSDILRLMAMIGFLCVLGLSFARFRDAQMWRWLFSTAFASQGGEVDETARQAQIDAQKKQLGGNTRSQPANTEAPQQVTTSGAEPSQTGGVKPSLPAPVVKRSELMPEEAEILKQELELVEDKVPLEAMEMGAYWRLISWAKSQTPEEMDQRARRDIQFTHLWERPSRYRGQLVRLNMRLVRSLRYEAEKNRHGVEWLYEGWGTTTDSGSNPYVVVFTDWPQGMPLGEGLEEDVTVEGYFLKLFPYNARDGKGRLAPLLIGRLNWHRAQVDQSQNSTNLIWTGLVIVCGVVVVGLGIWVFRFVFGGPKLAALAPVAADTDKVDDWLSGTTTNDEAFDVNSFSAPSSEPNLSQRSESI